MEVIATVFLLMTLIGWEKKETFYKQAAGFYKAIVYEVSNMMR